MIDYALVTGGVGGLGTAVVDRFLKEKIKVLVVDISEPNGRNAWWLDSEMVLYRKLDVSSIEGVTEFVKQLHDDDVRLRHCVSLAGGALPQEFGGLEKINDTVIEQSIKLNLQSHIVLARNVLPLLKRSEVQNKSVTFVSSINAIMDFGLPTYSAAKAGLLGLTKTLSSELGKYGIRVNCVLPGTVLTTRTSLEPKAFDEYLKGSVLGRFATPEEIGEVIFCIAEKLTCITGQGLIADCGQTVKGYYL
jgi:3-oxoacyl-[acyl-carrier protein] reductase